MTKYYVTVRAETVVTLEEVYLVHANNVDEAEAIVANGDGEWVDDKIVDYGRTISEEIIDIKSESNEIKWGAE